MTTLRTTDRPARFLPVFGLLLLLYACCAAPGWAVGPACVLDNMPPPGDPRGGFGHTQGGEGGRSAYYAVGGAADEDAYPLPGIGVWVPEVGIFILPTGDTARAWWSISPQLMSRYRGRFSFR